MNTQHIVPHESITRYVKNILVYHHHDENVPTVLPFFADGYPGIIYHTATNRMTLAPSCRIMKPFFLYGQTLQPIALTIDGPFSMVIFQLYPFALRGLYAIDSKSLNDDCFDLTTLEIDTVQKLHAEVSVDNYVSLITAYLTAKIGTITDQDDLIKKSIRLILKSNGTISIKEITEKLNVTERSLQRLFKLEAGISPKKFCKIIQFQASLEQLNSEEYLKLGQIAHEKGFADQSHFIRIFRYYTGQTPSSFVK